MPANANRPNHQQAPAAPNARGAVGPIRQQEPLTPVADVAPAVVNVPIRELSGAAWTSRFPNSIATGDLVSPFRENAAAFVGALRAAGAQVSIASTLRPSERAFLMHWCWRIVQGTADPQHIPARQGINIKWDHTNPDGTYNQQQSISAAQEMVNSYGIQNLRTPPSLNSRHIEGNAIDMSISWAGALTITGANGDDVVINSEPRTGMNTALHAVGASYGVIKYVGGARDKPHWSNDGH